ncbi:MAG: hypothetical protein JWO19_3020 [Bryobacterales bacterium]|nr:hypothetical protein [Bryobacterales bacterium]
MTVGKNAMNRPEWLALMLAVAAVGFQCFLPPVVGLANNGDFPKIIGQFDVGNPFGDKDVVRFADIKYVVDQKYHWESRFYSSELLLFATAFALNTIFGHSGVFDLRLMGAVHATLFLLAFYLLLPLVRPLRPVLRFVILFSILCLFTDVMYVSYFNSFYMDTAAFLFLLLAVVSFLRAVRWQRLTDRWLFVISTVLLITSKTQHYPLGIPIALLLAWKGGLLTSGRGSAFRMLSVAIVLAGTTFSYKGVTPSYYPAMGSYTVIFSELLPKSKNVASDLKELGLDDSYLRYVGTNAYSKDAGFRDPRFQDAFARKPFYAYIAWFFVKHPTRALDIAVSRLDAAGRQRPYVGNFDRLAGFPEITESRSFAVWSGLKARIFGRHGGRYLLYSLSLALLVTAFAVARRGNLPVGMPEAVSVLAAMTLIELLVASFADALDPERHYSLFSALTDLLLICAVCLAATTIKAPLKTPSTDPI